MARKFVSPGVFTQEIDQSYLAQGIASIGAAVVGRTLKGPAFVPTVVTDFTEFVAKFGDIDPSLQMPYAAKNYLKNARNLTVIRVLGTQDGNTTLSNGSDVKTYGLLGTLSSSVNGARTGSLLAVVHAPTATTVTISGTGVGSKFAFSFVGASTFAGTASFDVNSTDYVGRVFNSDPAKVSTYGHWLYKNFQWAHAGKLESTGTSNFAVTTTTGSTMMVTSSAMNSASYDAEYSTSVSPTVISQPFGSTVYNLFSFETLAAGASSTIDVKVSIANVMPSLNSGTNPYGTFDVIVRGYSDTDQKMVQLETFTNCDLNPASTNYVARRIGNQKKYWDYYNKKNVYTGDFANASKYIRIDMAGTNYDETALPWGHKGYPELGMPSSSIADLPYVKNNLDSSNNVELGNIWGVDFAQDGVSDRFKFLGAAARRDASATGADFSLIHITTAVTGGMTYCVYDTNVTGTTPALAMATTGALSPARNGFTMGFYGGFDGWDMTVADPMASPTNYAVVSHKAAIDTVANPDEIDMNILVIPGVTNYSVTDYGRAVCNQRADCMIIMDIPGSSVSDVIGQMNSRGVDDNYAACYYPDLRYSDTTNKVLVTVKPSVAILGAYAFNDRVKAPYFAPAGLNRGGLGAFGIVDAKDRLTFQDRNDLYEARINPIATFPNEGIVVFGQKTLQLKASALDRVNVRRLLIYAKKTIASAAKYLLFEPNNASTWQRFVNTVNPILNDVRMAQGLERFKVVMDSTTNTADLVDRNIMSGKIFLQPTRTAEYIDLSFIISSSGVSFGE